MPNDVRQDSRNNLAVWGATMRTKRMTSLIPTTTYTIIVVHSKTQLTDFIRLSFHKKSENEKDAL